MYSALEIILSIGAGQGLLLAAALCTFRSGNRSANRVLASLMVVFSFLILVHTQEGGSWQPFRTWSLESGAHASFLLLAPLMYLYVRALTDPEARLHWWDLFHFSPCGILLLLLPFLPPGQAPEGFTPGMEIAFLVVVTLQMIVYLTLMIIMLRHHEQYIHEAFSSLDRVNLHWLRFFVYSQLVIWPVAFAVDVHKHDYASINIIWLLVSVFMYITGYFGLRQPEIFSADFRKGQPLAQGNRKKYGKSALSPEKAEATLAKAQEHMLAEKSFQDPALTLPALAGRLGVSAHHLSQILNERAGKNFFDYVNSFRIDEAKQLLADPRNDHLTIAAVGFQAGFNSISSFNGVFKKHTGCTPSEFRNSRPSAPR